MATWDGDYGNCSAVLDPFTAQNCAESWGTLERIALFKPDADLSSFTAMNVVLGATWTAALAAVDPDTVFLTPTARVFDFSAAAGTAVTETKPANGLNVLVRHNATTLTVTFDSLNSDNEDALLLFNQLGGGYWYYITAGGEIIGKPDGKPFQFRYIDVQGRGLQSQQSDKQVMTLQYQNYDTNLWAKFDGSAFILNL
jgi:hypothetical protein